MQYYVVDTSYNWADEMDINCFTILREDELNNYRTDIKKIPDDFEYETCIGTNEEQIFTKDDIEYMLKTAQKISESDLAVLKKYVYQCNNDPICDFFMAYDEALGDEIDDTMEDVEVED